MYISYRTKTGTSYGSWSNSALWSQFGDKGDQGERGEKGEKGAKGDPGSNMPQAWVDEVTNTMQQNKIDISNLKDKDEQIALTFEEVKTLIGSLDVEGITLSNEEIKSVTSIIKKVMQKITTNEEVILNQSQKITQIENKIENDLSSNGSGDEVVIEENNIEGLTAKVIIDDKSSEMYYTHNEKQKTLKVNATNIFYTDMNENEVEELKQLIDFIRDNKEEFNLIKGLIGDLNELSTVNKQNVMESINEVCAIAHNAINRLEYDKINNKLNIYNYHGLVDELDIDNTYLEN